jgi:pentafunctional AROM polypeptide
MRGIGKGTIGKAVTARLEGYSFVDLDRYIETQTNESVAAIITNSGWSEFRRIETQCLKQVVYEAERKGVATILATGGGIIESPEAVQFLKQISKVVWLRTADDDQSIKLAVSHQSSAPSYPDSVHDTYLKRKPVYSECSSFDVYRTHTAEGLDEYAVDHLVRILSYRGETMELCDSKFVCLTAKSYTGWSVDDFRSAIEGPGILAVEIRVDKLTQIEEIFQNYSVYRTLIGKPVILTLRTVHEGGDFNTANSCYAETIKRLIKLYPDWIDIEFDRKIHLSGSTVAPGGPKIICSRHSPLPPSEKDMNIIKSAPSWADMIKIVCSSDSYMDSLRLTEMVQKATKDSSVPVIAVCTNRGGVISRLTNSIYTPVCSVDRKRLSAAAPGQLDAFQIDLVRSGGISNVTTRFLFHLFGSPISKSPSPYMHNLMFGLRNMAGLCLYSARAGESMADIVEAISCSNFRGSSITIPLKETMFEWLISQGACLGQEAMLAKSVNTVSLTSEGNLRGDNTDVVALSICLNRIRRPINTCLIIGTGGAARGALAAVKSLTTCTTFVYGRNETTITGLCEEFGAKPVTSVTVPVDIVIACVPSSGQSEFLKKYSETIAELTTIVEMAYLPRETPIVSLGLSVGCQIVYGSEILLLQGVAQHEIWLKSLLARQEINTADYLVSDPIDEDLIRNRLDVFTTNTHSV